MNEGEVTFQIVDADAARAETSAAELRDLLLESECDVLKTETRSTQANTQDGGALLVLVLGTPFAIAVAKGIAKSLEAFFTRRPRATIVITRPDGTVVHLDSSSVDAAKIASALRED